MGLTWDQVTATGLYTVHDLFPALRAEVLAKEGAAGVNGIQWFYGQPPVVGGAIEIDIRGIRHELRLG
jgi:hypothetical protein